MSEQESTEVMSWEEALRLKQMEQEARAKALAQGNKFISFKSGVLSVDKVPAPDNELEVIALAFCGENTWYKGKYDPTQTQVPLCWSVYTDVDNMIPHKNAKEKQSATCADCPKFKWGSDPMGGRGKACKSRYRLALLPGGVTTNDEVRSSPFRFATLPVTSGADFDKFMAECQITMNRPVFGVVARLKLVPDSKTQYKVSLSPLRPVPGELMLSIIDKVNEAEKEIMYEYQSMDEADEAPAKPLK